MSTKKWAPEGRLLRAIAELEAQCGGSLPCYGTAEHLAVLRYLVQECGTPLPDKPGKWEVDMKSVKEEFDKNAAFAGYASNAKKLLIGYGSLPEDARPTRGYK